MGIESNGVRKIATPKQTSGAGFTFEDKVVAFYLTWMLTRAAPQTFMAGAITRLDCQVKVDGWLLDDLLLTTSLNEQVYRYAFSIKSNVQFTSKSGPREFIRDAWRMFLHIGSEVLDLDSDMMGLICVPQPDPPITALRNLLKKAREQTPKQLTSRLGKKGYASPLELKLLTSFNCPKSISAAHGVNQLSTVELLKKIALVELDLD